MDSNETFRIRMTEEDFPEWIEERIDKCIGKLLTSLSRSYLQKLLKDGCILVNEKPVKSNYRLKAGDGIAVTLPPAVIPDIEPEDIPLDILYEDEDLLVVNKPKDMVVHPAPGHYSGTLVNGLMFHCKDRLSGINGVMRPGIVHRIDKDTTGSLLVCKNDFSHNHIALQLKEHSINRIYHAVVTGSLKADSGTISAPVGRHQAHRKKMAVNVPNAREAVTHYEVRQRFHKYTYIECRLETGRTHQIRVHMASIGYPVLGDGIYGGTGKPFPPLQSFSLQGQTLHARTLGFLHPRTGKYMEVNAPLPEYFLKILSVLGS